MNVRACYDVTTGRLFCPRTREHARDKTVTESLDFNGRARKGDKNVIPLYAPRQLRFDNQGDNVCVMESVAFTSQQNVSVHEDDIDNDLLIEEVEKRPALYDKNLKEYSDIHIKSKGWEEISRTIFLNVWCNLSTSQKTEAGKVVQKRWKNIRACFSRELREQKTSKSGQAAKKRRKYKHFDQLLFLIPSMENRDTSGNAASVLEEGADEEANGNTDEDEPRRAEYTRKKRDKTRPYEERLLDILNSKRTNENKLIEVMEKNKNECDADDREKHFALSLVPMLKAVPEDDKLDIQIQILQVFQNVQKQKSHKINILQSTSYFPQPGSSGIHFSKPSTQPNYFPRTLSLASPQNPQVIPKYSVSLPSTSPQNPSYINLTSPEDSSSIHSYVSQFTPEPDDSGEYDVCKKYNVYTGNE